MSYQKFFNPEESFTRSEIEAYQLERLKATVSSTAWIRLSTRSVSGRPD